ncbi:8-oxo-dGTP pyrophosphatase MutT, NUDIX family [Filomicrobium insigne]|uniref:8-oxo-dGTP pyrophosphatase MutT, NUDIX family n=1 Tax=Filomicrobium insigne TaxID=418854 RepID=A0A1H0LC07_9HYPH|nr:NUDIX hydrolase [Filomicrobium insigne]SDO65521.1 8-oxo-dGTP pyrophosphatase MutT, NUDIX family [Filomicrobium insigne]
MTNPSINSPAPSSMRPRDAATLIVVDHTASQPRILMGRRHPNQIFLPDKYVFPGGRSEIADRAIPSASELHEREIAKLLYDMKGNPSPHRARALAMAALRETYEETGLLIGTNETSTEDIALPSTADPIWQAFFAEGVQPSLSALTFLARAITPPGRPRRYDTRFFWVDAARIAKQSSPKDDELRDLGWFTFDELRQLDIPNITRAVVEDLAEHLSENNDARANWAVPYYYFKSGTFERILVRGSS